MKNPTIPLEKLRAQLKPKKAKDEQLAREISELETQKEERVNQLREFNTTSNAFGSMFDEMEAEEQLSVKISAELTGLSDETKKEISAQLQVLESQPEGEFRNQRIRELKENPLNFFQGELTSLIKLAEGRRTPKLKEDIARTRATVNNLKKIRKTSKKPPEAVTQDVAPAPKIPNAAESISTEPATSEDKKTESLPETRQETNEELEQGLDQLAGFFREKAREEVKEEKIETLRKIIADAIQEREKILEKLAKIKAAKKQKDVDQLSQNLMKSRNY